MGCSLGDSAVVPVSAEVWKTPLDTLLVSAKTLDAYGECVRLSVLCGESVCLRVE